MSINIIPTLFVYFFILVGRIVMLFLIFIRLMFQNLYELFSGKNLNSITTFKNITLSNEHSLFIIGLVSSVILFIYFYLMGKYKLKRKSKIDNSKQNKTKNTIGHVLSRKQKKKYYKYLRRDNTNNFDGLTPSDFEEYVGYLLIRSGFNPVKIIGSSDDYGSDILSSYNKHSYSFQIKYYKDKTVDNKAIQEVLGSLKVYGVKQGVVVTTSSFTENAKKVAKSNDIILINGYDLAKWEKDPTQIFKLFEISFMTPFQKWNYEIYQSVIQKFNIKKGAKK